MAFCFAGLCALAVHIGRLLYRSRHRAGRSFKSRRARCALTVLDALLWRQAAAAAVLSPSTLDVYTALAIVQGDRSSRDVLFALTLLDALLWRQAAAVALCSRRPHRTFTIRYIFTFAIVQGDRFSRSKLSCPISDVTGLLPERTHFASGALQQWPSAKLAPRSSKTSVDGAATRIFVTYASAADSTCPT